MNRNADCPCIGCTERWVKLVDDKPLTCHASCPRYDAWVKKREAIKREAAIRKEGWRMTCAQVKARRKACLRDNSKSVKKFSQ